MTARGKQPMILMNRGLYALKRVRDLVHALHLDGRLACFIADHDMVFKERPETSV